MKICNNNMMNRNLIGQLHFNAIKKYFKLSQKISGSNLDELLVNSSLWTKGML